MVELPDRADVVVIGGGITGCSILYHLAKAGCQNAILLEKHQIASGTTWHSAAVVTIVRGSPALASLAGYSSKLYASLEAETGQATGWRQCGHLNVAGSKDRLDSLRHVASNVRSFGLEVDIIGPEEVAKKWPLLRTDDLEGALWSPTSGRTNPTDTCQALLKGARAHGGRFFENTAVTGFEISNQRIKGVKTSFGTIRCDAVVNCTGLWAREVGGMADVSVPLFACEHYYVLTEPIEGITANLPTMRDSDAYIYVREEVGGLLVGAFEPNPKPLPIERLPAAPGHILLNEDWDHIEPVMRSAMHRIPSLETTGVRSLINGPESFTLDSVPLMGESPEIRGFFVACGMNSSGVVYGGGVGWTMAEWIMRGRPPIDLWATDVRRFGPINNNIKALSERIPEVLAKHFVIPWPGLEYETVRNVRRTPLHNKLQEHGAYFVQRAGWERPAWFSPPKPPQPLYSYGPQNWFPFWKNEHTAARTAVALFDQTPFSKLMIQGSGAEKFLQRVCANNLAIDTGRIVYTPVLNEEAGIESDLTVTRLDDESYLVVTGAQQDVRDSHWFREHIKQEHVTLTNVTSAYAVLGVAGPRARELLSRVTPANLSNESFPLRTAKKIELGYGWAVALRISYTGELGWELYIPSELATGVFEALLAAGSDLGLRLGGTNAISSLRIEKGFRSWGHDIGPTCTPLEAGLGFAVNLEKNEMFLGRDALLRQRDSGIQRRLVSFVFEQEDAFPHGYEPVYRNGKQSGFVTSASFGHSIGRAVALGWLTSGPVDDDAIQSDRFEIEIAERRFAAKAHIAAPWDPTAARLRA